MCYETGGSDTCRQSGLALFDSTVPCTVASSPSCIGIVGPIFIQINESPVWEYHLLMHCITFKLIRDQSELEPEQFAAAQSSQPLLDCYYSQMGWYIQKFHLDIQRLSLNMKISKLFICSIYITCTIGHKDKLPTKKINLAICWKN